jgi:DNA-binding LacI/PurR family transcriptional regulator
MGRAMVDVVLAAIAEPEAALGRRMLPTRLVVREST